MTILERRAFLRGSALAGASVYLPRLVEAAAGESRAVRTISIFHTTDLHGHIRPARTYGGISNVGGLARCASQIRQWKKESPHSLLLDIGDVYQGTAVGWMTRGRLMIDLFKQMDYDGWVMGNHEFDWGPEVVLDAVSRSTMPVLTGNMKLEGKQAGTFEDSSHPLARIVPHIVKNVGGIRIGVLGITTPGLPYWLRPELLNGFEVTDPVETMKASLKFLREEAKVDAVIACGHMGLGDEDDFANRVLALLETEGGPDVYLGAHTHRDHSSRYVGKTLYSQADYFGIHCGRVDLSFDLESRRVVEKRAYTVLMDERIPEDPLVLEIAGKDLGDAKTYLAEQMGELAVDLSHKRPGPGQGSPLQGLIASSIMHAAARHDVKPDGVFHGTFGSGTLAAGMKTVAAAWTILPYDNRLVALYLTREELVAVLNESLEGNSDRALFGFEVGVARSEAAKGEKRGGNFVRSITALRNPGPKPAGHRYCIVFNAYDAQSGGRRLMRLRALAEEPECKATLLPPTSRQALIDFFADRGVVKAADLSPAPAAPTPAPTPPKVPAPLP
ncbi:MAG: bifunctional UDP-sugar hydrolase/5'-nucleotidase [Roseibacillus sp.]